MHQSVCLPFTIDFATGLGAFCHSVARESRLCLRPGLADFEATIPKQKAIDDLAAARK